MPRHRTLRRYARLLGRYLDPHRAEMALLALILGAAIGVQVASPLIASNFVDDATAGRPLRELVLLALATIAIAVLGQAVGIAETYVAERVSWAATNEVRADLLRHLLRLDSGYHNAHAPGESIERVDGDVATLARFFSRFVVYVVGNGLLMAGVLALLYRVDWRIGLGLTAFVAVALAVTLRIRAMATPSWAAERQATADFFGYLGEYLAGLEDVRSSGAGGFVLRRCAEFMRAWWSATVAAQMRGYAMFATSEGLFGLGLATSLAICAVLFRAGALSVGAVYLVFVYSQMLRRPAEQIRNEVQELQQADASMSRIETLLATPPRLVDGPRPSLPSGPLSVELESVWFGYAEDVQVLRDVTVRIEPGRVLGVVGRTGSGKTTLVRLLPRLHDPSAGTVRLSGVDLREARLGAVRSRIGLVSQEVHLFNASLRDNLTVFDAGVPDRALEHALAELSLEEWLSSLPDGLDTPLGVGGTGLSAGEAQLVAFARVLLREPDLVVLDEASSRLDPATDRRVHAAMSRLLQGRTGVIVAHRLSTMAHADEVLVLEEGRVREHGPRQALATDPTSRFAGLLQLSEEVRR